MSDEYAPLGTVGVLTPQANTTVEPEFGLLLPPGAGLLAGRLTSPCATIEERLRDYFDRLDAAVAQFAGVPLRALGFACTGASYLAGAGREDAVLDRLSAQAGYPVVSSARAVVEALRTLDAVRIALVSPYPDDLTRHSIGYWQSRGFAVGPVARVTGEVAAGSHPIYGLGSDAAIRALAGLRGQGGFAAVVVLGTGLPSLRAIREMPAIDGAPVLSCSLALAWRCAAALDGGAASARSLREWIGGSAWADRLRQRTRPAHGGDFNGR